MITVYLTLHINGERIKLFGLLAIYGVRHLSPTTVTEMNIINDV
jgi:hypothetical protein